MYILKVEVIMNGKRTIREISNLLTKIFPEFISLFKDVSPGETVSKEHSFKPYSEPVP